MGLIGMLTVEVLDYPFLVRYLYNLTGITRHYQPGVVVLHTYASAVAGGVSMKTPFHWWVNGS